MVNIDKLNQTIEEICDLIIKETNNNPTESRSKKIKELAVALAVVANAKAAIERFGISD